ncbi:MAG: aminotransferase class IV [Oligoflexia bacterium]|nr:aminotransferase class IV [Oligoflexia bacterium]
MIHMHGELVSINKKLFKPKEAKISVFDRGFLYGDSVYEVVRRYDGVFYAIEEHIQRLFYSAQRIGLNLTASERDLIAEIYEVAHESGIDNAYMRIIITRGQDEIITLDPTQSQETNTIIVVKEAKEFLKPEIYEKGIEVIISSIQRNSKKAMDPSIKSGNYLNNVMALGEAKRARASDAIMLNVDGNLSEGTSWNFFIVKNGQVLTPPDDAHILLGVTRGKLKRICQDNNIGFSFQNLKPQDVYSADEAFSAGSFKEIVPIIKVDGKKIGQKSEPGLITKKLMGLYQQEVQKYCQAWLSRLK